MRQASVAPDRFERGIAIVFATVAVLGVVVVILTSVLYATGGDASGVPLP